MKNAIERKPSANLTPELSLENTNIF